MTKKSIKWVARLISIAVLASLLLVSQVHASININVEAVQKSVAFLYAADSHGDVDKTKPIGTGFFVEIPLKSDPQRAYRVLVTARHMVDPTWAQCGQANPEVIYARVNKKTYTPGSGVSGVDFYVLTYQNKENQLGVIIVTIMWMQQLYFSQLTRKTLKFSIPVQFQWGFFPQKWKQHRKVLATQSCLLV